MTALITAAFGEGSDEIVRLLIDNGANCDLLDNSGKKAIDYVKKDSLAYDYLISCTNLYKLKNDALVGKSVKKQQTQKYDIAETVLALSQMDNRLDGLVLENIIRQSYKSSTLDFKNTIDVIENVLKTKRKIYDPNSILKTKRTI